MKNKEENKELEGRLGRFGSRIIEDTAEESVGDLETIWKKQVKTAFLVKKEVESLGNFKEPVLLVIRRNRLVDFKEDVKDPFILEHSTGKKLEVRLPPGNLLVFPYANRTFKGYILNEDAFMPEPQEPVLNAERVAELFESSLLTSQTLEARKKLMNAENKGKMTIVWIIAAIFGGIILLATVVPPSFWASLGLG